MLLKEIKLSNWRSHHQSQLSFSKGSNLIIGGMGTGKSSIVEAISFSLFGNFPMLERKKIKLADVVRKGQERADVELSFTHKGSSIKVVRSVTSEGKHSASLFVNGKIVEKGVERVSSYIKDLLLTDYFNFTRAVYSEQNNLSLLLEVVPSKRKEQIDSLLGFDKFEIARTNISTALRQLNSELIGLRDSFRPDEFKRKKEEFNALSNRAKELETVLNQITAEVKSIEELILETRKSNEMLSLSIANLRNSIKRAYQLRARLEVIAKDISDSSFTSEQEDLLFSLRKQLETLEIQEGEYTRKKDSLLKSIAKIEQLEKRKLVLLNEIKDIKKIEEEVSKKERISLLLKEIEEAESLSTQLKQRLSDTENLINILSSSSSHCPVCRRPLKKEDAVELMKEYSLTKENLSTQITSLAAKIKLKQDIKKNLSYIEKAEMMLIHMKEKEKEIESISKMEADKAHLLNELSSISFDSSKKEDILFSLRKLEEQKRKSESVASLIEEKKHIDNELMSLEGIEAQLEQKEKEQAEVRSLLENYIKELSEKKVLIKERRREHSDIQQRISNLQLELKKANEIELRIAKLTHLIEQIDLFKLVIEESQTEMRSAVIDALNTAITRIWKVIYPYSNYEAVRIGTSENGYEFEVFYDGKWYDINKLMSGGEKTAFALAFRVSLASVLLPDINILILDEPTHNLDRESVLALSDLIEYGLSELVEQSFIITHDENLISADRGKYFKLSRDKNKDEPTKIEEI